MMKRGCIMCDKLNLQHIHHVAIIGSNYERSRHFYVDILGFAVIRENYREEQQDWKIDLRLADAELELFIKEGCPPRAGWPGKEAYGLRHLAFRTNPMPPYRPNVLQPGKSPRQRGWQVHRYMWPSWE